MTENKKILVIDDEHAICVGFERFFTRRGWQVLSKSTATAGLNAFVSEKPDVVFCDVRLPDKNGLEVLDEIRQLSHDAKVVIITAYGSLDTVTQAVKGKAFDYLAKPLDLDKALEIADRALQITVAGRSETPDESTQARPLIVGASHVMQDVYKKIGLVAMSDASVLILGQTGVGKDLVARAIHQNSSRSAKPFVAVNCGALPENLIESELFGHQKGAFTGADSDRAGKFETADGGTLFLDEVGELPHAAQVKLLRVLDSQTIERVGGVKPISLDVRILAATNRDLAAEVAAGRFRADLYYRLNVIHIEIPPLNQRKDDIVAIAKHFLRSHSASAALSEGAVELLCNHSWPGNVRELRNAIEHAAVLAGSGVVLPEHLPESVRISAPILNPIDWRTSLRDYLATLPKSASIYRDAIEHLERELITQALDRCNGNQSEAADFIGLHRNTLRKKIRELGIEN